jgi:hypothetical protein
VAHNIFAIGSWLNFIPHFLDRCEEGYNNEFNDGFKALLASRPVFLLGQSYYKLCARRPIGNTSTIPLEMGSLNVSPLLKYNKVALVMAVFLRYTVISEHFRDVGMYAANRFAEKIKIQL